MMRRNDSGTTEGRKKERKIEKERERKGIALCNQLSLRLFFFLLAFSLPRAFLLCCVVSLTPHLEQVRLKASLVYKAPSIVRERD